MHWRAKAEPVRLLHISSMWMRPLVSRRTIEKSRPELEAEMGCRLKLYKVTHPRPTVVVVEEQDIKWFLGWIRWLMPYYTLAQWQIVDPD